MTNLSAKINLESADLLFLFKCLFGAQCDKNKYNLDHITFDLHIHPCCLEDINVSEMKYNNKRQEETNVKSCTGSLLALGKEWEVAFINFLLLATEFKTVTISYECSFQSRNK